MREIAEVAGISKALLYHYFPSKTELFKAAAAQYVGELQAPLVAADGEGTPSEQLNRSLDAYLGWIEANSWAWAKLMQSAATLPEAVQFLQAFRTETLSQILEHLTALGSPPPLLRNALNGWLGYVDGTLPQCPQQIQNAPSATARDDRRASGRREPLHSLSADLTRRLQPDGRLPQALDSFGSQGIGRSRPRPGALCCAWQATSPVNGAR